MHTSIIAIVLYSLIYFLCSLVMLKMNSIKFIKVGLIRCMYGLLTSLALVFIGRAPFGILAYRGLNENINTVINIIAINYFLFSLYFIYLVVRNNKNIDPMPKEHDHICDDTAGRWYAKYLLVLLPIFLLLILLNLFSECHPLPSVAIVFQVAIIAPIFEEIGFRLLLPRIANKKKKTSIIEAIAYSVVFSLLHFQISHGLIFYLTIFISSLYCYYIANKTCSVKYAILYHSLGNLLRLFYI